eukprot:TRINITY_DN15256_c0_g1_i1.p1 TRINITY_DN15256_c0_g1~~TRINITY_DN15256_c0_g1_i1.p1  ORF type:complete len:324 (-),score=60.58 TRINITY_DN15256_c0_g1_i1:59-1030(-)
MTAPPLGLDVAPSSQAMLMEHNSSQEILLTTMGGEVYLLHLRRPAAPSGSGRLVAMAGDPGTWSIELGKKFKDHSKHVASGLFAPPENKDVTSQHFLTVSRDHKANLYSRATSPGEVCDFSLCGTIELIGEVTCCSWASERMFVLAARDDYQLHFWDVGSQEENFKPKEKSKINLNALGDSVVSFTVLALAVSPDRSLIAACTDKSRVIVLQMGTARQLRNLYGAVVNEYDVPSVCFSLDGCFIYVTSTLPAPVQRSDGGYPCDEAPVAQRALCGQLSIFEVRTSSLALQIPCHEKAVRRVSRHPHAEMLVTGSFDKTVKYWG